METLSAEAISSAMGYAWIFQLLAVVAIALGKIVIVVFLEQLLRLKRAGHVFLWFIGISSLAVNVAIIGVILAQCSPMEKLFNDQIPGTCNDRQRNMLFGYFQGSLSPQIVRRIIAPCWMSFADIAC